MSKIKKLEEKDKKNRNKLVTATSLLFLNTKSNINLYSNLNLINKNLKKTINSIKDSAKQMALEDVKDFSSNNTVIKTNPARTSAVAMSITGSVVVGIDLLVEKGEDYSTAVRTSLDNNKNKIELIAVTEFFTAYNQQTLFSLTNSTGYYEWNAQLDKQTCSVCSSLSGKQYTNQESIPPIPSHPRCRCIINFYPL